MSPAAHHKDGGNAYRTAMDKVLEKNPPVIVWRKNKHGIQIAVQVIDPHTETSIEAQAERLRQSAMRAEWFENHMPAFAAVAAEETEPEDETLKNAARNL